MAEAFGDLPEGDVVFLLGAAGQVVEDLVHLSVFIGHRVIHSGLGSWD